MRRISEQDNTRSAGFHTADWGTHMPRPLQSMLISAMRNSILQRGKLRHLMTRWISGMGQPLDITFRDLKFRIAGQNNLIETGILARPSYNATEIDFLSEGMGPGAAAVDIGCNIGLYTLPLARAGGRVVAIDANAAMIDHLNFHLAANDLHNVSPLNLAVGAGPGRVDLRIHRDDLAIVAVQEAADGAVEMRDLLTIVTEQGLDRIDALKIDIEGHEDAALVPFFETAPEHLWPRRVVIEFLPPDDYPGAARAMRDRGYRLVGRTRNNSMYARD